MLFIFFTIIFTVTSTITATYDNDIKNKYDIDNSFCQAKITGSSINYTTFDNRNFTFVLAGNAYKYNLSCNVNDKNFHIGDKHYVIDLLLYGPIRQLKAWRYTFNTTTQIVENNDTIAQNGVIFNQLAKQLSFGWIGQSRLLCIVKKYNYVLNKFTRCEQNLFMGVKEKVQPQLSMPSLQKYIPLQASRKLSIATTTTTTTKILTTFEIITKSTMKIVEGKTEMDILQPVIILTICITLFLSVIFVVVYVMYCRTKGFGPRHFFFKKTNSFSKINLNNCPLSTSSQSSDSAGGTDTTISLDDGLIYKCKESINTLDSISSRCSRYIDEKEKCNQNDDSLKFI
jgi:hypothetical protein